MTSRAGIRIRARRAAFAALVICAIAAPVAFAHAFLTFHGNVVVASTVPANGDLNPYGVAVVPTSVGRLRAGSTLVSNFNDAREGSGGNEQGRGSTIVEVGPGGRVKTFAAISRATLPGRCPGGVGLTTALAVLPHGWVIVGSLPTADGSAATARAGCLIVLDDEGRPVETIAGPPIDGPWDLTAEATHGGRTVTLFVTNVLNGTVAAGGATVDHGTVARIRLAVGHHAPRVIGERVVAKGFPEQTNPEALVIGPTGVALAGNGDLYVADAVANRIAVVPHATTRRTAIGHGGRTLASGGSLSTPLGLTLAPNGDVIAANAGNGELVETTSGGSEVATFETGAGAGGLFGIAVTRNGHGLLYVDDSTNALNELR